MKNRRIAVISIVLVAVLCLGVGYAALTDDMSVTGNLSINKDAANEDFDMDVHFDPGTAATITKESSDGTTDVSTVTATVTTAENGDVNDLLKITIPAGVLNFKGDKLTVKATVVNNSTEFDATVKMVAVDGQDDALLSTVSCTFNGAQEITIDANGGTAEVTVVITLNETVTGDEANKNGDFSFAIGATAVDPTP